MMFPVLVMSVNKKFKPYLPALNHKFDNHQVFDYQLNRFNAEIL